jgi:protein farnesyltransferase/geranylgeranyltransferase type-1 subunit alpha
VRFVVVVLNFKKGFARMSLMSMMIPVDELSDTFSDLTPIPQDDGPEPVCVIQYPTSFRLAYDYLRAVWKADELSERSLKLSALGLKLNPANYTVWQFRRRCLRHLGLDKDTIQRDLDMTATLGGQNPKNYQIWFHRRALLKDHENLKEDFLETELEYNYNVLQQDSKNHHAWSHRQWFIKIINDEKVWKNEIEFGKCHYRIHYLTRQCVSLILVMLYLD